MVNHLFLLYSICSVVYALLIFSAILGYIPYLRKYQVCCYSHLYVVGQNHAVFILAANHISVIIVFIDKTID